MNHRIGFMQGRLCEPVDGKIQAFPWRDWESEFSIASSIDMHLLEWTIDQERLYENPLMTAEGQKIIRQLCQLHDLSIPSLTGDCFMQQPFWKVEGQVRTDLQSDFLKIVQSCSLVGIQMIAVPLVDNGSLDTTEQEDNLIGYLLANKDFLTQQNVKIIFESDFAPAQLARFIKRLPPTHFGINYDMGNSAALGFDPVEEFKAYGPYILNVHVKDRMLNGGTVALGEGSVHFTKVFSLLKTIKYNGNYILQTARSNEGQHLELISKYIKFIEDRIN